MIAYERPALGGGALVLRSLLCLSGGCALLKALDATRLVEGAVLARVKRMGLA